MIRLLPMIVFLVGPAAALDVPLMSAVCHSAPEPNATVTVNIDCASVPVDRPETTARLYYSTDGQNAWTEVAMTRIGGPGYDSTYERSFPIPGAGTVYYYVAADNGSNHSTQAPFNSGNAWPPGPNLMARVAPDSTGDASNPEGPYLDLTGAYVGYSDSHFYFMLTNDDTEWPTSGGLLKWFAYAFGLSNPAAPYDTWVFGPIYVDAWPVMQHGLFAINRYTGATPERIGDIEHATDGNRLMMRCLISDLTDDERFGPWPNDDGWLIAAANTQSITPGGATTRDTTAPGRFQADRTPGFVVGDNRGPSLLQPRVVPDTGGAATEFWFSVRYLDPDSNLPLLRSVVVDGDSHPMTPSHHRYWLGVPFSHTRSGFEPGRHYFRFTFGDGMSVVESPLDSFHVTGSGIAERCAGGDVTGPMATAFRDRLVVRLADGCRRVEVWNTQGRRVLYRDDPGELFVWDGRDVSGRRLPSGVYFVGTDDRRRPVRVVRVE